MQPAQIRLKVLLQQRHWQTYRTFCLEYNRVAQDVDPDLVATGPSRAQFHRWLSGELKGLPYPDHCRVLEKMFTGWTATQLFELIDHQQAKQLVESMSESSDQSVMPTIPADIDLTVFVDLNGEDNRAIFQRLKAARQIFFAAHTGYNAMVSQYQSAIRHAIGAGGSLRVVVTDPNGPLMRESELKHRLCPSIRQEGEIADVLYTCARHRDAAELAGHPRSNVQARVYRGAPSMNILMADGWLRVIPYLPLVAAADCPVFEYQFDVENPPPVIQKFILAVRRLWEDAHEMAEPAVAS